MFYDDEYKAGFWQGANDAKRGFSPMPQPTWSSAYREGYADGYYETRGEFLSGILWRAMNNDNF